MIKMGTIGFHFYSLSYLLMFVNMHRTCFTDSYNISGERRGDMFSEAIIIPVIIAVTEVLKGLGLPRKFAALVSLVLGVVAGVFYLDHPELKIRIFQGLLYGLSAAGLYSGAKNTIQEMRNRRK